MRNEVPMKWIEQAEARDVLVTALFESEPLPSWYRTVRAAGSERLSRMLAMIASIGVFGGPLLQPQPALLRPAAGRRDPHCREDDGYHGSW